MRRFLPALLALVILPAPAGAVSRQSAASDDPAGYYFMLALQLEDTGKVTEAIAALRRAIELAPGSAEVRAELAALYARQDRVLEALDAADDALTVDPANREANRILGSIYAALAEQRRPARPGEDPAQYAARATTALEKARHPSRVDPGLDLTLGRLYLRAGLYDKAIEALQRVVGAQPEYAEGGLLLAAAQEAGGHVGDAIGTLESTVRHSPAFFRGYIPLIALYERERRWKEAAGAYALAQGINPEADLVGGRAAALMNSGAVREGQALVRAAIAKGVAPDAALLYLLAESQRRLGDYEGATTTARTLRDAFPEDARSRIIDAQVLAAQGKKEEAIRAFGDLVKRLPDEPAFAYQHAQLLEEAGRVAEAEQALRDLLVRDPHDANALNSLGYLFADRGLRLDEAVDLLQRAVKIEPGNPSFLDSLGWAFYKQGQLARADGPLAEAAAKMPENSVIQDHLGDLRFRQQRYSEAVVAWERALAGDGVSVDRAAIEKKLRDARERAPKASKK